MNKHLNSFLNGAFMMACLVLALLFARFKRDTGDRFFKQFAVAFALLGIERIAILLSGGVYETHPSVYLIRCSAFLIIIYAVIDKNKAGKASE